MHYDKQQKRVVGPGGALKIAADDEVAQKLLMLLEGECEGLGPIKAAKKYGYSKQRYFQLRKAYLEKGIGALENKARGPTSKSRRTSEMVKQIIRHRFLDAAASAAVIAQKIRQTGLTISTRSVERVFEEYGLQKKTL